MSGFAPHSRHVDAALPSRPKAFCPIRFILQIPLRHHSLSVSVSLTVQLSLLQRHFVVLVNDHITFKILHGDFLRSNHLLICNFWEWCEDLGDVAPPLLAVFPVPVHRDTEAPLEACLLIPTQLSQLRAIHCITPIVKGTVMCVLDPFMEFFLC